MQSQKLDAELEDVDVKGNKMKITKEKLLSIIKEEVESELEEKSSDPLHEAYYAMRDFVDNLRDEALQEEGIDLADDLFDAIHDVMPFPDQD